MKKGLLTFGICSAIVGGLVYLCKSIKEEITVDNLTWEREVEVEAFKEVEETATTVPEGATVTHVATESVKESPDKVVKRVLCYTYTIKKWALDYSVCTTGDSDTTPYFDDEGSLPEDRRYGKRTERYFVIDTNGNLWTTDYAKWYVLRRGEKITIKHSRFSSYISKISKGGI